MLSETSAGIPHGSDKWNPSPTPRREPKWRPSPPQPAEALSPEEIKKIGRGAVEALKKGKMPATVEPNKIDEEPEFEIEDADMLAPPIPESSKLAAMSLLELRGLDPNILKAHPEILEEAGILLHTRLQPTIDSKDWQELPTEERNKFFAETSKLDYISKLRREIELSERPKQTTAASTIQIKASREATKVRGTHQIQETEPDKQKRMQEIEREINTFGKAFKKRYVELLNQDIPKFNNRQEENNYKALDLLLTEKNILSEQVYPTKTTKYQGGTRVETETDGSGTAPTYRLSMDAKTLAEIKGPLKQIQPGEKVVIDTNKYGDEETIMAVKNEAEAIKQFFGEKEGRDFVKPVDLSDEILDLMESKNITTEANTDALLARLDLSETQLRSLCDYLHGIMNSIKFDQWEALLYKSAAKRLPAAPARPPVGIPTPFRLGGTTPTIEQKRPPTEIPTPFRLGGRTKLEKRPWWKKIATGVAAAAVAAGIYAKDRANDEAWPDDEIQPIKISGPEKAGLPQTGTKSIETKTSLPPPAKSTTAIEQSPLPNIRTPETKPTAGTALPKPPSVPRRPLTLRGIRQPERRAIAPKTMTAADKAKWDQINRGWNAFTHRGPAELDKEGGTFASVPPLTTPRSGPKGRPAPPGKKGFSLDIRERSSRFP